MQHGITTSTDSIVGDPMNFLLTLFFIIYTISYIC